MIQAECVAPRHHEHPENFVASLKHGEVCDDVYAAFGAWALNHVHAGTLALQVEFTVGISVSAGDKITVSIARGSQ